MLSITKDIRTWLLANEQIANIIGTKVYPIIIKQIDVNSIVFDNLPQIVLERTIQTNETRDYRSYTITLDVTVITTEYSSNIDLITLVDSQLMKIKGNYSIRDVELQSVSETFANNAYMTKLTYTLVN